MTARRVMYILLAVIGTVGAVFSVIQFVMAVSFGEWGRVMLYLVLSILCFELAAYALYKLIKRS